MPLQALYCITSSIRFSPPNPTKRVILSDRLKTPSTQQCPNPLITHRDLLFNAQSRLARFNNQKHIAESYSQRLTEGSKRIYPQEGLAILNFT